MNTIKELVDFVMNHRKGKAFEDWTPIELATCFVEDVEQRELFYSTDNNGLINGIVHVHINRNNKIIFVRNILTTSRGVLKSFIKRFAEWYPTYKLEARRHDRFVAYDTNRLTNKILGAH